MGAAPRRRPRKTLLKLLSGWLIVPAIALLLSGEPAGAPKAWTWRGGESAALGVAGVYGPCDHWQELAWSDCLLSYSPETCADEGGLALRPCDAFEEAAWPGARAGHALAVDLRDDGVWLFGGMGTGASQSG